MAEECTTGNWEFGALALLVDKVIGSHLWKEIWKSKHQKEGIKQPRTHPNVSTKNGTAHGSKFAETATTWTWRERLDHNTGLNGQDCSCEILWLASNVLPAQEAQFHISHWSWDIFRTHEDPFRLLWKIESFFDQISYMTCTTYVPVVLVLPLDLIPCF